MSDAAPRFRSCQACFELLEIKNSGPRFLVCGGCRDARYCSKTCQRNHWKIHKPRCRLVAADLDWKETSTMAKPSLAALDAAFDEFCETRLFDEILAYTARAVFGLWSEKPAQGGTTRSHILSLRFASDITQIPTEGRRHQFALFGGYFHRLDDIFPDQETLDAYQAQSKSFEDSFEERSTKSHALISVRLAAESRSAKDASKIRNLTFRLKYMRLEVSREIWDKDWCPLSLEDDWLGFAQRAFRGPVPRNAVDLHAMRAKEIGRDYTLPDEAD